jgi:lysophospholipase L1-like esterase
MADARGGLPKDLSLDGVHPKPAGYAIMNPLVEAGIARALDPQAPKDEVYRLRNDWANLERFHDANATLPPPAPSEQRVVFMGDSITQNWLRNGVLQGDDFPPFFPGKPYVNRGISGQTTPQMLVRFRPDVIGLKPSAVVILAGINDIAGNTGDMTLEQTEENLATMAELAASHHIRVILCSVLPAYDIPWRAGRQPMQKVTALNAWIKSYAESHEYVYVDFYSAMVDARGGLPPATSKDGVHPNQSGYAIMNPLVEAGIAKALAK